MPMCVSTAQARASCSAAEYGVFVCGIFPVIFHTKWLLWHAHVRFACAGSHKTCASRSWNRCSSSVLSYVHFYISYVLSYVCSSCVFHMCAPLVNFIYVNMCFAWCALICVLGCAVLSYVCSHMCALTYVLSSVCSPLVLSYIYALICVLSSLCSPLCALIYVLSCHVLSYVCSHMCASHLCALICVLSSVCTHMCALICVLSYVCSPLALIYVLSFVCSQMCARICLLSYVCSHMCALICLLSCAPICLLLCALSCVSSSSSSPPLVSYPFAPRTVWGLVPGYIFLELPSCCLNSNVDNSSCWINRSYCLTSLWMKHTSLPFLLKLAFKANNSAKQCRPEVTFGMPPTGTKGHDSESSGSASTFTGGEDEWPQMCRWESI